MSEQQPVIVFAVFPGVTQLDFTAPHQVFSMLPGAEVIVASVEGGTIESSGLIFAGLSRLADITRCDVICVPGGYGATDIAGQDENFLRELRRLAATARFVTSVCRGSLTLAAAGLLRGKRAASHWAWRDQLALFGAIPDPGRVVRDGNIVTGGGVTAGIDFALTLIAEIAGPETAQAIQLQIEYAPAPPFDAGRPETAPPEILKRAQRTGGGAQPDCDRGGSGTVGRALGDFAPCSTVEWTGHSSTPPTTTPPRCASAMRCSPTGRCAARRCGNSAPGIPTSTMVTAHASGSICTSPPSQMRRHWLLSMAAIGR
jgi:putative intracellular protease/amidase